MPEVKIILTAEQKQAVAAFNELKERVNVGKDALAAFANVGNIVGYQVAPALTSAANAAASGFKALRDATKNIGAAQLGVYTVGLAGLFAILKVGSFYWEDYTKATKQATDADTSAIDTNQKLIDTLRRVARERKDVGAITVEVYDDIMRKIKAAENQVTIEGQAAELLALRSNLRSVPGFEPAITRSEFEKNLTDANVREANRFASTEFIISSQPGFREGNEKLRLWDIEKSLTDLEKQRKDIQFARTEKIISENEFLKLQTDSLTRSVALERDRRDIIAQRIASDQSLTHDEKIDALTNAGADTAGMTKLSDFGGQMRNGLSGLSEEFTIAANAAGAAMNAVRASVNAVSTSIYGAITGTNTWGESFKAVVATIIQGLIQVVVQWIAQETIVAGLRWLFGAKDIALARTSAESWREAAYYASVASYGAAAVVGAAALISGYASTAGLGAIGGASAGFMEGGYTGDGPRNQIAGYVHRGEVVIPADVVNQVGVGPLTALAGGAIETTPMSSSASGSVSVKTVIVADLDAAMVEALKSPAGEQVIVQTVKGRKIDLGMPT